ncbi:MULTISPECIES: hypothetical protein [Borreliella]
MLSDVLKLNNKVINDEFKNYQDKINQLK